MRALFLALILANLVFFFWEYTLAPTPPSVNRPAAEPPQDDAPPLVLLKDADKAGAGPAGRATPAPKPPVKAASKPPVGMAPPAGDKPPASQAPAKESKKMACYIIGPFDHADAARAAVTVLQAKGLEAAFEQRQAQMNRYWLHTPVLPSRKAALARMKDIEARGIHDMALMRTGDLENSVSLGFYHNESSAKRRLAALEARQIDVTLDTEHTTVNTYWARYRTARDSPASDAAWQTITASHTEAQREGLPCR